MKTVLHSQNVPLGGGQPRGRVLSLVVVLSLFFAFKSELRADEIEPKPHSADVGSERKDDTSRSEPSGITEILPPEAQTEVPFSAINEVIREADPAPEDVGLTKESMASMWPKESQQTLEEVAELHERLIQRWDEIRETVVDEAEFRKEWVLKNKVIVSDPILGTAELNMMNDKYFVRVSHRPTELTFAIFNDADFDPTSKHFQQWKSRQAIMAGQNRPDGQTGRDVVVIKKNIRTVAQPTDLSPSELERYNRHTRYSLRWWGDYWRSIKKAPSFETFGFGAICGVAQGGLGHAVACLKNWDAPDLFPAWLSLAWGTGIGTFVGPYKNWTNLGSVTSRTIKSSVNSFLYAYTVAVHASPRGLESLTVLDEHSILLHLSILGNVLASNLAKVHWTEFSRAREIIGLTQSRIRIPNIFTGTKYETSITRASAENQAVYLAPFTIRLLDLTGVAIGKIPLGKLVLWGSIPAVEWLAMKYVGRVAEKTKHPKAIELHEHLKRSWDFKKAWLRKGEVRSLWWKSLIARVSRNEQKRFAIERLQARKFPNLYDPVPPGKRTKSVTPAREFVIPNPIEFGMTPNSQSPCNLLLARLGAR